MKSQQIWQISNTHKTSKGAPRKQYNWILNSKIVTFYSNENSGAYCDMTTKQNKKTFSFVLHSTLLVNCD